MRVLVPARRPVAAAVTACWRPSICAQACCTCPHIIAARRKRSCISRCCCPQSAQLIPQCGQLSLVCGCQALLLPRERCRELLLVLLQDVLLLLVVQGGNLPRQLLDLL